MFDEYIAFFESTHLQMSFILNQMNEQRRKRLCSYTTPLNTIEDLQQTITLAYCDENGS